MLRPLHRECVGHVPDSGLGCTVGRGWDALLELAEIPSTMKRQEEGEFEVTNLIGPVRSHGRGKHDRPLDPQLDECPRRTPGRVECAEQLECPLARTQPNYEARRKKPTFTENSASISSVVKSSADL